MSVHLVPGIRPDTFVLYDGSGFYYHKHKSRRDKHFLSCIIKRCPGTAMCRGAIKNGAKIFPSQDHNHDGNMLYRELLAFKRKLNERSKTESTPLRQIYDEEVVSVPPEFLSQVKFERLSGTMYKARKTALDNITDHEKSFDHMIGKEVQEEDMGVENENFSEEYSSQDDKLKLGHLSRGHIQMLLGVKEHTYCTAYESGQEASTSETPEPSASAAAAPSPSKWQLRPNPRAKYFPGHDVSRPQLRPNRTRSYKQVEQEEDDDDDDYGAGDYGGGVQEEEEEGDYQEDDSPIQVMWENKDRMSGIMTKLFESGKFVDCTLACQGRHLQCHRLVLGACSDYFEDLLQINPSQHPIIMMRDFEFWEVEAVVDFIYKGVATVPMSKFNKFIQTARLLQIKGITQMDVEGSTEEVTRFKQMSASQKKTVVKKAPPPPPAAVKITPKVMQRPVRIVSKRKAPVQLIKEIRPVAISALSNRKTVEPAPKVIKVNPKKLFIHKAFGNLESSPSLSKSTASTDGAATVLDYDPDPGSHISQKAHLETGKTKVTTRRHEEVAESTDNEPTETEEHVVIKEDDYDEDDGTEEFISQIEVFDHQNQEYTDASESVIVTDEPSGTVTIENVEETSQPPGS